MMTRLRSTLCGLTCLCLCLSASAFPLKVSENRRHLVDQQGRPFFIMGDTPWFIQKQKIEDVRRLMDDRLAKGFNTLFLELLDDERIPPIDAQGNTAFNPPTDITKPVEDYWRYAEQVMDEAAKRGLFVIHNSIWFGAGQGLWMHHVTPEKCRVYGDFIAKRFARFPNVMWMHVADRNPDERLTACARELAAAFDRHAPQQLQTTHLAHEFASATHFNDDAWLDVNLAYTYGAAYLQVLPEYQRSHPVRPVIFGETGYEDEPNAIELLPDAKKGDLWNPYRIRRNAWWGVFSGASGYCAGTRLWRWEKNWREVMQARSTVEAPNILKLFQKLSWWRVAPDAKHAFLTAGFGEWKTEDYATAALAEDGSCGVVYLPTPRTFTVDLSKLRGPVRARWFDPTANTFKTEEGSPLASRGRRDFTPPGNNAAGEPDWVLVLDDAAKDAPAPGGSAGKQTVVHDYAAAFKLSLQFYEAQQSGKLSPHNRFPWRGDSCLKDGQDSGRDLSGGWYDAGDHWKCTLTMGYAASVMAWNVATFPEAYERHGQIPRVKENLRHVTDYFLKCIVDPAPDSPEDFYRYEVYVDIGGKPGPEPGVHSVWEGPETIAGKTIREAVKVNRDLPGSDMAGVMAATLCGVAVLFQNHAENDAERAYARQLLWVGRKLFLYALRHHERFQSLAQQHRAGGDKLPVLDPAGKTRVIAYCSLDGTDEVVWAALWAHRAELALQTPGYARAHLQAVQPLQC